MKAFQGIGVLITGAGRGIGKRLAIGFAAAGAHVGLLARSKAQLDLADLEIEHAGGKSLRLRADVRKHDEVAAAVARMTNEYGATHVLICATGALGPIGALQECDPMEWADAIQTNVAGVMNCCRAVIPQMKERRGGKIIILSCSGADGPRPNFSASAASHAALVRLAETLAEELRDYNIQVNCFNPGATYTSSTDEILHAGDRAGWKDATEAADVRATGGTPPEKQLQLAFFLASERANHISGKLLYVDDNWKKLENATINSAAYTLRRLQRV